MKIKPEMEGNIRHTPSKLKNRTNWFFEEFGIEELENLETLQILIVFSLQILIVFSFKQPILS